MDQRFPVKSGWLSKLGNGWWPTWKDRFFVLYNNGEFDYHGDESLSAATYLGSIHLSAVTGLRVVANIAGSGRPGLSIKTEAREFQLAGEDVDDLETSWVPSIMAVREGRVRVPEDILRLGLKKKEEEILLTFSMDSEEEVAPQEPVPEKQEESKEEEKKKEEVKVEEPVPAVDKTDCAALDAVLQSWDNIHKRNMLEKTLLRTVNYLLAGKADRVRSVSELSDGIVLCQLLEILGAHVERDASVEGRSRYEHVSKVANVTAVFNVLNGISTAFSSFSACNVGIVVSGNVRSIVFVVWAALYFLFVKTASFGGLSGVPAIVQWVYRCTAGYQHVRISDLTSSFIDGFALNAILHFYRKDAIDYESLQPQQLVRNMDRFFAKAKELLGVPILLESNDFIDPNAFDETSIVLFLTAFLKTVENQQSNS